MIDRFPTDYLRDINDKYYQAGKKAFEKGASLTQCIQSGSVTDQFSWMCGWWDALADKLRNVEKTQDYDRRERLRGYPGYD